MNIDETMQLISDIRLLLGQGHSGYGLYAAAPDYPERIAEFRSLIEGAISPPEWATDILEALRDDTQVRPV